MILMELFTTEISPPARNTPAWQGGKLHPHLLPRWLCHTKLQRLSVLRTHHAAQCNTEGKDLMRPHLHGLKALEALRLYLRPGPKGEASKAEICRGSSRRQPIVSPCGGHVASFRGLPSPMSRILARMAPRASGGLESPSMDTKHPEAKSSTAELACCLFLQSRPKATAWQLSR